MHKEKGLTLIELVVSMIIVGILFASISFIWPSDSINVDSQAQQLVSDINYIRLLAMANHNSYQVNFTSTGYTTTETDGTTPVRLPAYSGSNAVSFHSGITASYSNSILIFDNLGVPYSSVSTPLNSTATITLTAADGSSYTISITSGTGYISIS